MNKLIRRNKRTFKGVQSRALAKRSFYIVKLVIKLCVDVVSLVGCYNTADTNVQEKY